MKPEGVTDVRQFRHNPWPELECVERVFTTTQLKITIITVTPRAHQTTSSNFPTSISAS